MDSWTNHFRLISVDVPTTMVALDRNTAENNVNALQRQAARLPGLECFQEQFDFNIRMVVADRASSNIRSEKYFKEQRPTQASLQYPCDIHKKATCLKSAMNVVNQVVSGVVNVGLAMESIGSLATLRQILQSVFQEKLQIVYATPPAGDIAAHRKHILDLCCSSQQKGWEITAKDMKRRLVLEYFCNSDLESDDIIHYCPFGCCSSPQQTMEYFCKHVTWALLPKKPGVLSRKSWVGADSQFNWVAMLAGFWHLHKHVLLAYTGSPEKPLESKPDDAPSTVLAGFSGEIDEFHAWNELAWGMLGLSSASGSSGAAKAKAAGKAEADDDELEDDTHHGYDCDYDTGTARAGSELEEQQSWAEFNRSIRKKAAAFLAGRHFWAQVFCTRWAMAPGLHLLYTALNMAGKDFDVQQDARVAKALPREFRVLEAAKGTTIADCFIEIETLLLEPAAVLPLSCFTRYCRSLCFRILSAQACSIELTLRRAHRGFPYQLYKLLKGDETAIDQVYSLPSCFHDDMASTFFKAFPSKQSANSPKAQALLSALCQVSECDIANIESGHSSVREWTRLRGRGHVPNLAAVGARCLCSFFGKKYQYEKPGETKNDSSEKQQPQQQKQRGGGGAYRVFIAERAAGKKLSKDLLKNLNDEYHSLELDEYMHYYEWGLLATLAHRRGVKQAQISSDSGRGSGGELRELRIEPWLAQLLMTELYTFIMTLLLQSFWL